MFNIKLQYKRHWSVQRVMRGRVWRLHVCPEAEESAKQGLYCSASRSSPQGRQRGLGGEQDNKIKDLWQPFTSRTSNHMYRNGKANHFSLASVTFYLPEAQQLCSKMLCICWQLEIHPSVVTKYGPFCFGKWSFNLDARNRFELQLSLIWNSGYLILRQTMSQGALILALLGILLRAVEQKKQETPYMTFERQISNRKQIANT